MAYDNDVIKLTRFLDKLNQNKNNYSPTKEPNKDTKVLCNIPVNISEKEKLHHLQKCLKENQNCISLLKVLASSVHLLLDKCVKEQKIVSAKIQLCLRKKGSSHRKRDHYIRRILSTPYFKDENGFSQPPNEDILIRSVQGFDNPCRVVISHLWNESEKNVVAQYIRNVEEEKWTETLKSCNMLHLADVEQMTLNELVESRYDEYDWLKISVSCLENAHSPEECRALWFSCLHPQINQQAWSEEENKKLKTLGLHYNCQNWDKIVRELGTKRSALQCITHFKKHLCEISESPWTEKEIGLLKCYVKLFRYKGYIPWNKIKKFMDGRSLKEIFKMWNKINREGRPRTFSLEEDIVLVAGMRAFGYDHPRITEYLPDRTVSQVRRRIEVLKCRQFPKQAWSAQEDALLRNLVDKYGFGNWLKISMHFVNRSQSNLRTRCITLLKREGSKSHTSLALNSPRKKTDIVNITLLWESIVKICQENNICSPKDILAKNFSLSMVHELSQILKPQMRLSKTIEGKKLKQFSDREYNKFFRGAYTLNESNKERTHDMKEIIHTLVHEIIVVLKLLEAKIDLPHTKELNNDTAISYQDKLIIKYLMNKIEASNDVYCDLFLPSNMCKQNVVVDETASTNLGNSYLFPPSFSTLLAMRSLLLNDENQERQKQGLTMQLDNLELKEMNTFCSPRKICYGENYVVAGKIWIERMNKLLGGVSVLLNEKGKNCRDTQQKSRIAN